MLDSVWSVMESDSFFCFLLGCLPGGWYMDYLSRINSAVKDFSQRQSAYVLGNHFLGFHGCSQRCYHRCVKILLVE